MRHSGIIEILNESSFLASPFATRTVSVKLDGFIKFNYYFKGYSSLIFWGIVLDCICISSSLATIMRHWCDLCISYLQINWWFDFWSSLIFFFKILIFRSCFQQQQTATAPNDILYSLPPSKKPLIKVIFHVIWWP